jgi:hypothetical protein
MLTAARAASTVNHTVTKNTADSFEESIAKSVSEMSFEVTGTTGLKRSGGYVHEEFLNRLKGSRGVEFFREFTDNNPQAGAIRFVVEALIRQADWNAALAEKPDDLYEAERAQELLKTSMNDMDHTWQDFIVELLSALRFGFSYFNIVYKIRRGPDNELAELRSEYDDGAFGWRMIQGRSQDSLERWEFDDTGKLLGMWQMDGWTGKRAFIDINQAVHFRIDRFKDNPEGRSMYRNAAISYMRLKALDDIEAIGSEREMTGVAHMQVPASVLNPRASANDAEIRRAIERSMGAFKRNERDFLITPSETTSEGKPSGYKFTLVSGAGSRTFDITKVKDSHKADILLSCLSQFLMLGLQSGNQVGSHAQAISATGLLSTALTSWLDMIVDTVNKQLVAPLMRFNNIKRQNWARVTHGDVQAPTLAELGAFLETLFTTGLLNPTEQVREHAYKAAKIPFESSSKVLSADELVRATQQGEDVEALLSGTSDVPGGGKDTVVELLNGAQLASLVSVVEQMSTGVLPKASAASILQSSLGMDPATVESILAPVEAKMAVDGPAKPKPEFGGFGGFKPKQQAPAPLTTTPAATKSADDLIKDVMP